MAGSVNKVLLIGNLGSDPEVRRTQDGKPVVNLSVATSETWKDKASGERKEKTEWHRVVIWNEGLWQRSICKRARRFTLRARYRLANGRTKTGRTNTRPRLS